MRFEKDGTLVGKSLSGKRQNTGKMAVEIKLACTQVRKQTLDTEEPENLMTPGDVITTDTGFMR